MVSISMVLVNASLLFYFLLFFILFWIACLVLCMHTKWIQIYLLKHGSYVKLSLLNIRLRVVCVWSCTLWKACKVDCRHTGIFGAYICSGFGLAITIDEGKKAYAHEIDVPNLFRVFAVHIHTCIVYAWMWAPLYVLCIDILPVV